MYMASCNGRINVKGNAICEPGSSFWVLCGRAGASIDPPCDEFGGLFSRYTKVKCLSDAGLFLDAVDVSGGHTLRKNFGGVVNLQGVHKNLPGYCTNHLDPTLCFFPQNLIANIKTPLFLLNAAYDSWQLQASLAPVSVDPHGYWRDRKMNNARCSTWQIQYLQGFGNQMLNAVKRFSMSKNSGLFINSCFAQCQTERQDTWFADDSPVIRNKSTIKEIASISDKEIVTRFFKSTSRNFQEQLKKPAKQRSLKIPCRLTSHQMEVHLYL